MPNIQPPPKTIVVTGDVTVDWQIAHRQYSKERAVQWQGVRDWTRACWQRGGAALLADLIEAVAESLRRDSQADYTVRQMDAPRGPICPTDDRFHHSYALWMPCKSPAGVTWRVEAFLGLDRSPVEGPSSVAKWQQVVNDTPEAALVVLDDADLGFRDHPDLWPQALTNEENPPWILLKLARPVAAGSLWDNLSRYHADHLIVVTTASDLRQTEVQISQGLSWERTAQDVAWELVHNPRVNGLARCAHVVVSFGAAGAVVLTRVAGEASSYDVDFSLVFDPQVMEGTWEQGHAGSMIGYTTCLAAGLARQLMLAPDRPDVLQGVQNGLAALRQLYLEGYVEQEVGGRLQIAFPIEGIAARLARDAAPFAVANVQDPVRFLTRRAGDEKEPPEGGFWTILQDRYRDDLDDVAQRIVARGVDVALQDVPLGRFGALLTVDRQEIEGLRSIHSLAQEYLSQERQKRPLSIAVFGSPGSGKSFGITQVAKSLAPGLIQVLEFNLSQFEAADELADALHQVRDVALGGQVPLVFWDEFDTPLKGQRLGWLRYFLVPMQDGRFREGQLFHPIGRAIFVFAGGTSARMADFGRGLAPDEQRAAKLPDFVSRLKGFVNVLGPNRQQDSADPYYIIRRAILLRSILQRNAPQIFSLQSGGVPDIDPGLLRAFLQTRYYKHGVRSMEAIVAMSSLAGQPSYERSSLPAETQLDLHVDGLEFLALMQQLELAGEMAEKLAKAHHQIFCDELAARGYRFGERTDEQRKLHSSLRPYDELPEEEKRQNVSAVRDIPHKLACIGYAMIPARSNEPPFEFPGPHLEQLAMMEHERWMAGKLAGGWQYAPQTDKEQQLSAGLLPWEQLPEEEKEKDRALVRAIPRILARAGYTVVELKLER
ncbi:MAG: ATPase [Anaerolineae bacterium]|nr:ATPase [Anaerolineae bacterium]